MLLEAGAVGIGIFLDSGNEDAFFVVDDWGLVDAAGDEEAERVVGFAFGYFYALAEALVGEGGGHTFLVVGIASAPFFLQITLKFSISV